MVSPNPDNFASTPASSSQTDPNAVAAESGAVILVTGAAGFIGYHTVRRLLAAGHTVVGLDSLNDYYDVSLKEARLAQCGIPVGIPAGDSIPAGAVPWNTPLSAGRYTFVRAQLEDAAALKRLFQEHRFSHVCHLAAQAGVRYSLTNPKVYVDSNVTGFLNLLESCRAVPPRHLVYASTSSVYGLNQQMPFHTERPADHPVSLYAATKKANEAMAHTYAHLFGLPCTGLRFFTVYGPWGRPDMALFLFTDAIINGRPITVFNNGEMQRDFTYVDDIVEGVTRVLFHPAQPADPDEDPEHDPSVSAAPFRLYNIGNGSPVPLMDFVRAVEEALGRTAEVQYAPMQPGDVAATWADVTPLERRFGFKPNTPVTEGVRRFVEWYLAYYRRSTDTATNGNAPERTTGPTAAGPKVPS